MSTILIVDDTQMLRDYIAECLSFEGYNAVTARNGADGVHLATQNPPDLIICDVMMPGLSGYDVLEKLRSQPTTAEIPFIFLTALASHQDKQEGLRLGVSDYLTKPFSYDDLMTAINNKLKPGPAGV